MESKAFMADFFVIIFFNYPHQDILGFHALFLAVNPQTVQSA